ncbi:MAG: hypothetical protein HQK83_14885 [Fibrobacteria bacterium]|nr:hypothetical protein [Fibrobacteria bacterium]
MLKPLYYADESLSPQAERHLLARMEHIGCCSDFILQNIHSQNNGNRFTDEASVIAYLNQEFKTPADNLCALIRSLQITRKIDGLSESLGHTFLALCLVSLIHSTPAHMKRMRELARNPYDYTLPVKTLFNIGGIPQLKERDLQLYHDNNENYQELDRSINMEIIESLYLIWQKYDPTCIHDFLTGARTSARESVRNWAKLVSMFPLEHEVYTNIVNLRGRISCIPSIFFRKFININSGIHGESNLSELDIVIYPVTANRKEYALNGNPVGPIFRRNSGTMKLIAAMLMFQNDIQCFRQATTGISDIKGIIKKLRKELRESGEDLIIPAKKRNVPYAFRCVLDHNTDGQPGHDTKFLIILS